MTLSFFLSFSIMHLTTRLYTGAEVPASQWACSKQSSLRQAIHQSSPQHGSNAFTPLLSALPASRLQATFHPASFLLVCSPCILNHSSELSATVPHPRDLDRMRADRRTDGCHTKQIKRPRDSLSK